MLIHSLPPAHIAWFEKSNQWIQLDDYQFFILNLYREGLSKENAVKKFSEEFGDDLPDSKGFVYNLYQSFETLMVENFPTPDFSKGRDVALHFNPEKSRTHFYAYRGLLFSIRYGSLFLESYIHPGFMHLSVQNTASNAPLYEVFPLGNRWAIRINNHEVLTCDESPHLKRLLYVELSKYFFRIPEEGWMTRIHASAVYKENKLLLIASPSGSGKSTFTALLMKQGYRLFADDFIPACIEKELLYPFPAALCIKAPSFTVMEKEGISLPVKNNFAGYLTGEEAMENIQPLSASVIIFVRYVYGASLQFKSLQATEALQIFMDESWVSNHYQGAKSFIEWFSKLKFYHLEYGDNEEGVRAVLELID